MEGRKASCPACGRCLHVPLESTPPRLRCPACKARLRMDSDGVLHLREGTVVETGQPTLELHPVPETPVPAAQSLVHDTDSPAPRKKAPLVLAGSVAAPIALLGAVWALTGFLSGTDTKGTPVVDLGPASDSTPSTTERPAAAPAPPSLILAGAPRPDRPAARSGKTGPPGKLAAKPRGQGILPAAFEVPRGIDRKNFERAVARGVNFLKAEARKETLLGARALAGLTLLHCGVSVKDAEVRRLAEEVRKQAPRLTKTYEISCCIWFLDRLGDKADRETIRALALNLVAAQGVRGGWGYDARVLTSAERQNLLRRLQQPLQGENIQLASAPNNQGKVPTNGNQFPKGQGKSGKGSAGKTPAKKPSAKGSSAPNLANLPVLAHRPGELLSSRKGRGYEDNSATQFVVLALWAAQKHGVPAGRSLAMVESRFQESQAEDGGWIYEWDGVAARLGIAAEGVHADSMTCAGLLGLAVGRGAWLERRSGLTQRPPSWAEKEFDRAIEKALRFLERRIVRMRPASKAGLAEIDDELNRVTTRARHRGLKVEELDRLLVREKELRQQHNVLRNQVRSNSLTARNAAVVGANSGGDLYFLWSLARMAVVYDLKTIGQVDWYAWGAPRILAAQKPNGSWASGYPGVPDTCFALLFLRRANVAQDLTDVLQAVHLAKTAGNRGQGQGGQGFSISQVKGLQ